MELLFNITELIENQLTPNDYYYLYNLSLNNTLPVIQLTQTELQKLEAMGWLKVSAEGVVLRGKFNRVFKKQLETLEISTWIEDWRNLWPAAVKTGGRPVKGSKANCFKKMKSFVGKHPEYTKEMIFDATRGYLFERSRQDYRYITSADYFIEKDGVSLLDSLIQHYAERGDELKLIENGGGSFHKEI